MPAASQKGRNGESFLGVEADRKLGMQHTVEEAMCSFTR
jgi:hypothetical protein